MNKPLPVPVTLTDRAADEVRRIKASKEIPENYQLRVGVRGSGCGGATSLLLGFDKAKEEDQVYEDHGIPIIVNKGHVLYIFGKQVDYVDTAEGAGFVFNG